MNKDMVIETLFSGRCQHNKFILDESLEKVKCGLCGQFLNPMWVLRQLSTKENRYHMRIIELHKIAEKAEAKNSCKCEHCQKMTRIQR